VDERPVVTLRVPAQRRLDDAVGRSNHHGELGSGVNVQFVVNVHQVRRYRPFTDAKPVGDLSIRKPVDDVPDDFAFAAAQLLVKDGGETTVRDEMCNAGPVRVVLAAHQGAKFVRWILIEQVEVVERARVLHDDGHERVFVVRAQDLAARRASEPQLGFRIVSRHGACPVRFIVAALRTYGQAEQNRIGRATAASSASSSASSALSSSMCP